MDFSRCPLYGVESKKELSYLLKVPTDTFKPGYLGKHFISGYYLKNKKRIIHTPSKEYKAILHRINELLCFCEIPYYEFGGIPETGTVDNVALHLDNRYVLRTDIKHFFPSVRGEVVHSFFFHKLKMSKDCAAIITTLVTQMNSEGQRFLPQGFPTSSLVSLFAYIDLFEELALFAENNQFKFSVYYDDITFSSDYFIPKSNLRIVKDIIKKYKLEPHKDKTMLRHTTDIKITGVVLNYNELKIPRSRFIKLNDGYGTLKYMKKNMNEYDSTVIELACRRVVGIIASIKMINSGFNDARYVNIINYLRKRIDKKQVNDKVMKKYKNVNDLKLVKQYQM